MTVNYDRVCRLCLSSRGELLPIFSTTSSDGSEPPVLASKIKDCVSVQIKANDDLPNTVCRKCINNVNNWHTFKKVCERTQNKLQSLVKKDGSLLEEVKVKSEPFSDEAYDDGVVIDGSYPDSEQNATPSNKIQPEGPPILASLGLTPRSDKGVESEKDEEEEEEEEEEINHASHFENSLPNMPEVSITVMRPTGETLPARQGIAALASKNCLVCGRSYRYSHNARRHELNTHGFDRYTNKVTANKKMQPKLRPNPFNPKARLMPNPISQKMQLLPKNNNMPNKQVPHKIPIHPKPIPIKAMPTRGQSNSLPYPLRIKALKDLQIKKKEPQILKTLLTSKPEVLVSEPEIMNSGPGSPETLISEPEIASFQVEAIITEPDTFEPQAEEDEEINAKSHQNAYDTVDMESDNEIEIARQQDHEVHPEENFDQHDEEQNSEAEKDGEYHGSPENENNVENAFEDEAVDSVDGDNDVAAAAADDANDEDHDDKELDEQDERPDDDQDETIQEENDEEDEEIVPDMAIPIVDINDDLQKNSNNNALNETEADEDVDMSADANDTVDTVDDEAAVDGLDPDKQYITKTQEEFIKKYRDIIEQINTKRCKCCDKEYPRRKAVIQHLQKNGHKVPKHTCYNCVVTFPTIGALLSHMRANVCTHLWKIIYSEEGITEDMVVEEETKDNKMFYKDIFNARSYACKLCPAKYQLKQFMKKHVIDCHEGGQSRVTMACVHCGSRFKDRGIWKRHIRNGECIIYIACDLCTERFATTQDFNNHALEVHAGSFDPADSQKRVDGRPTDCPMCDMKNATYQNLVKHLRVYHGEDKPHYCQNCDAKFETATDLNNHIYMAHADIARGEIPEAKSEVDMSIVKEEASSAEAEEYHYSCTECNAIFETVDAWTDHQVAEHNQIAHHCDQCEKKFLRPSELAEHKNTHLRVKLYPCSICSDSYSTPQKLADHVQQVHPAAAGGAPGEMNFFCEVCIRAFKSRQAYSNHMRIHAKVPTTNRRPMETKSFAPQIIGKPIGQLPILQQPGLRINSIVPNAPYSCDICGKGFMHKKNIWKHKKVLHADLVGDRNDSEENTMHASTEEDEYNIDENGTTLSTPQFDSFNFSDYTKKAPPKKAPPPPAATIEAAPEKKDMFSCELCFKKFPMRSSLWKHKRAKHGIINPGSTVSADSAQALATPVSGENNTSRTSCTICKISFSDKKSYYRHRKNVHKSTSQVCKICGIPLNSTLELYEHLKAAHARELLGYNANQTASKPQEPSQELELDYEGEQEVNDPSSEYQARYPCDTCGKQFIGLLALQNHQCINQMQSQSSTFDCEICHKSYTSIAALKSHRGWHLRSPDGKAAANNSGLWMPHHKVTSKVSKHEVVDAVQLARVTHSAPPTPPTTSKRRLPPEVEVTVVNPNKRMRSDDSVELDQGNSSTGLDDKYCTICDKEFTKRAAFQRHMDEVHQPNSVFCPVCDKSFTRKSTLLVHMKKHYEGGGEGSSSSAAQDEGAFGCEVCGAQYQNAQSLRMHRAKHHGEEEEDEESEDEGSVNAPPGEFTCGQCGDGVATPRDLIAHRNMHSTPSKHFCNICKVYFSRSQDLSAHTRARHSDSEKVYFPCAMCDRFYTNKKSLQRHIEMAH